MVVMILMTPQFVNMCTVDAGVWKDSLLGAVKPEIAASLTSNMGEIFVDAIQKKFTFTHVFGIPMIIYDYSGNVFVPLITTPIVALIYKGFQKIIPNSVHLVFVPTFTVLIGTIIAAFITGPLGILLGSLLGIALQWMYTAVPFVFMIAIPLIYPFLVPVGLHWPLNALMLMNISQLGYDFIQGPMGVWNFACFGTTFGVMLIAIKEKDKQMRSTAGGALAAGLLGGVSEPSLYGIHLRYKKTYRSLLTGCLIGGIVIAVLGFLFPANVVTPAGAAKTVSGVTANGFAFTSLLTIPMFNQMWVYGISIAVAFVVPVLMILKFDYRTPEEKAMARAESASARLGITNVADTMDPEKMKAVRERIKKVDSNTVTDKISSPVAGKVSSLAATKDSAFEIKALGEGTAVIPNEGENKLLSPISGEVVDVAKNSHAYTIEDENGVKVLIHVGVDTVNLEGKHFSASVEEGDIVNVGDQLAEVNYAGIREDGYKNWVIVTVVNTIEMAAVKPHAEGGEVNAKDEIINVERYEG